MATSMYQAMVDEATAGEIVGAFRCRAEELALQIERAEIDGVRDHYKAELARVRTAAERFREALVPA